MKFSAPMIALALLACASIIFIIHCAKDDDEETRVAEYPAADDDSLPVYDDDSLNDDDDDDCINDDANDDLDNDSDDDIDDDANDDVDDDIDDDVSPCPDEMAYISGGDQDVFCMDKWEASRPDATVDTDGVDEDHATSRPMVMPWRQQDNALAAQACQAAGKSLCAPQQWYFACCGPLEQVYAYGNSYEPLTCNGIDAFKPEPHHLAPTGSFPQCVNHWGVFDLNGNLWEQVLDGDSTLVRGGAYNCGNSEALHRCDYIPGWPPSSIGFRCCKTP